MKMFKRFWSSISLLRRTKNLVSILCQINPSDTLISYLICTHFSTKKINVLRERMCPSGAKGSETLVHIHLTKQLFITEGLYLQSHGRHNPKPQYEYCSILYFTPRSPKWSIHQFFWTKCFNAFLLFYRLISYRGENGRQIILKWDFKQYSLTEGPGFLALKVRISGGVLRGTRS